MKIWIDLDNSPHVHFFAPIIKELKSRGCQFVITARSFSQTEELAHAYALPFTTIGSHRAHSSFSGRATATFRRAFQLMSYIRSQRPDISISHGSRACVLASRVLRIPTMTLYDYEFVSARFFNVMSNRVMAPEYIPFERLSQQSLKADKFTAYPGFKEEVYVHDFTPNPAILNELGLDANRLIICIRPPATWAHYHDELSEVLFRAVVRRLWQEPDAQVLILTRTTEQAEGLRERYGIEGKPFRILTQAVDGLSLMWFSDAVFSGGGTMVREAALMGAPAYSIFGGKLGAADELLARQGKLHLLRTEDEVLGLSFRKMRHETGVSAEVRCSTRTFICDQVVRFANQYGCVVTPQPVATAGAI